MQLEKENKKFYAKQQTICGPPIRTPLLPLIHSKKNARRNWRKTAYIHIANSDKKQKRGNQFVVEKDFSEKTSPAQHNMTFEDDQVTDINRDGLAKQMSFYRQKRNTYIHKQFTINIKMCPLHCCIQWGIYRKYMRHSLLAKEHTLTNNSILMCMDVYLFLSPPINYKKSIAPVHYSQPKTCQ